MRKINWSNTKELLTEVNRSGVTFREAKFRFRDVPTSEDQFKEDGATDLGPQDAKRRAKEMAAHMAGPAQVRDKGVVNGI